MDIEPPQLALFNRYHDAVNADRYRVTVIKYDSSGDRAKDKVFILDKNRETGETRGFTPDEIARHMPEMLRLHRRGENVFFTPLSDTKHHILIDDMSMEKLKRLISDDYKPAALIQSSQGNFQAIITIPKLGSPFDRDVANRVTEFLNKTYGDPRLVGAIHAHRAPGFENRKLKHKTAAGTYPQVLLVKAERRECQKTLQLAHEFNEKYMSEKNAILPKRERVAHERAGLPDIKPDPAAEKLYMAHYRHIMRILPQHRADPDYSALDSMIAVRLAVTGHERDEIARAILSGSPKIRPADRLHKHNWPAYAADTANFPFEDAEGIKQVNELIKYRGTWAGLEKKAEREAGE